MKKIKQQLLILAILPLIFGCESIFFEKENATKSAGENFEYLWKECNEKYAYMDYKKINWNAIHDQYAAKIHEGMSDDSLFSVLGNMLNELKDGHVNLKSYFNVSHYNFQQQGPDNFNFRLIEDNYLPKNYYVSGPFIHDFIAGGKVGYIRFNEFTGTVTDDNLNFILKRYASTQGIIFDIRENGGGAVSDVFKILSHLVYGKVHVYDTRIKSGKGYNEFSEKVPGYAESSSGYKYAKQFVILTDRGTFSAASFTTLAARELANVTIMGDTTGGGLGLPNGGQLPNGWIYRFSITQTLDLKGNNYENGIPPDIQVVMKAEDAAKGKDTVIERALKLILG